jgi:hypothetical protein
VNRNGAIPMDVVLRDCRIIYRRLLRAADNRSMVHGSLIRFFGAYEHGRTYQGYFRDAGWLLNINDKSWSVTKEAVINEEMIRKVRAARSKHRRNAEIVRYLYAN